MFLFISSLFYLLDLLPLLLISPSVDRIEHIGLASRSMLRNLWLRFYPDSKSEQFDAAFPEGTAEEKISMAAWQGILLRHKEDSQASLQDLKTELQTPK